MNDTPDTEPPASRSGKRSGNLMAGMAGGLIVALLTLGAFAAGLVGKTETTTTGTASTVAQVANSGSEDGEEGLVHQIYERDGAGVGFIVAKGVSGASNPFDPDGESQQGTATGSGFLIDDEGHMVTNNHVIDGASSITVTLGEDHTANEAEVVGTDPSTDLALIKVDAPKEQLHPLTLGDSDNVKVGDLVVAIGNPFGLSSTVTTGIVSALQREIASTTRFAISDVIQTDAAINPGNSGGPLINADGEVIGVNSQIATGGGSSGNVGIGFAIPSRTVKDVVSQIKKDGKVTHAFLGITGAGLSPDLVKALNLDVDHGVLVQEVVKGGPAAKAGIETGDARVTIEGQEVVAGGDVIVAVDGEEIHSMEQIISVVNGARAGDTLKLTVQRGKDSREVKVTLGERPAEEPDGK